MSVRPDNRLADFAMTPLDCLTCGARVEVRKSSWDQTSIQWHDDSVDRCVERRATTPGSGANGTAFQGCAALRATVREAAVNGTLRVVDDAPLKVNPEAPQD
jgi:hypothetical protein